MQSAGGSPSFFHRDTGLLSWCLRSLCCSQTPLAEPPFHPVGLRHPGGVSTMWGSPMPSDPVDTRRGERSVLFESGHPCRTEGCGPSIIKPRHGCLPFSPSPVGQRHAHGGFWEQARTLVSDCSWSRASFSVPTTGM